jgi:tetratricopeptide (TPR) repeat protein
MLLISLLVVQGALASKISVAVFPLKNESDTVFDKWIGYGFAETVSRTLKGLDGFRVWDPVFLYQTDSTDYEMVSDSLLRIHRNRWAWDVAIGGAYRVDGDTVHAKLKVLWAAGGDDPLKVDLVVDGRVSEFFPFCGKAVLKVLGAIQYPLSSKDSASLHIRPWSDFAAYRTFAAGYGFEMQKNQNAALTAYARAEEIDPRYADASLRAALLYCGSNDFKLARTSFERAVAGSPEDPTIIAEYAEFLVRYDAEPVAIKFINSHRGLLENSAEGLKAIGEMYMAAGEYQRAIALLTKAVAFGPGNLDVEFSLGSAYLVSGEFQRAIDIFNQLIQYRPKYMRYYASLGGAYRKSGQLMESTIILESAEKIAPDNTTILIDLAHTYIKLGWFDKAGQLLVRAREISPLLSDIELNLGVVYWYQGKKDEAMKCFRQAASISTTRQSALNNMGTALFQGGSPKKAIEAYTKANETGHKNEIVLYNLAMACYAGRRLGKAAGYFDQMLQLSPDRIDVLLQVSSICVTLKRYGDAERYFHKIIELMPDNETAIRGLTSILIAGKRYKEAVQPVEDFLERQPLNREFLLQAADLYHTMGWDEVALMRFQTIIKEFPYDSSGYLGAGECMYAMIKTKGSQDYDNAISVLNKACEYAPRDPRPEVLMGDIYADYKNYRELAVEHWKKALDKTDDRRTRKSLEQKIAGN